MAETQQTSRANIIHSFELQAQNPPGKDLYISAFDGAMVHLLGSRTPMSDLMDTTLKARPALTSSLVANLFLRVFQFELLKHERGQYPQNDLLSSAGWEQKIDELLESGQSRQEIEELLLLKDTTTTVLNRYIGLRTVVNSFICQNARILDVGCSLPIGLDSARRHDGITSIKDNTPQEFVSIYGNTPISYEKAIGTDITDPFSEDARTWREACSCYPNEIKEGGLNKVAARENALQTEGIEFIQSDITKPGLGLQDYHQEKPFDVVQMATMLYQLSPDKQLNAVHNSLNLIREGGILIIQDFVDIDETQPLGIKFSSDWGNGGSYKTVVFIKSGDMLKPLDLLHWDSGRCNEVSQGKDFRILQEAFEGRST